MKKFLLIIFSILFFTHAVTAQEIFRVTSVNFDTSNSIIFLTSPDNTAEPIMKNVKVTKLQNPKRIYFDINSAVLTSPPQNWFFNTGGVKQVKVNQFSTNPNKIRVLLYLEDDYDPAKISFIKVNNNLALKLTKVNDNICKNSYFQKIYSDEKTSSKEFYENLSITNTEIEKVKQAANIAPKEEVLNQIQQAFEPNSTRPGLKQVSDTKIETIRKELKLKSKFYLSQITVKTNGVLLTGIGAASLERPMYLTNPARVVFDLPNSIVNSDILNKEYKIGQDIIKVGQFDSNKVRVIITSSDLEKYFPVFSADGQSILFVNTSNIDITTLFSKTDDAVSYFVKNPDTKTSEFIMAFNGPVVTGIKRDSTKLTLNFYNTLRYNEQNFRSTVGSSSLYGMKIDLLPKVGLKLTLPLEKDSSVSCYLGEDGKSIRILAKGISRPAETCHQEKCLTLPKNSGKKSVVLDAGHGGSDYGAIRAGINEKDINLDIVKKVQSILASKGVSVAMTRNTDDFISLPDRTIFTANSCPDIFVSVHVNSSSKQEISGIETHYYHENSMELAQTIHSCLISEVKTNDRGLFKSKFYVINHTDVPAILVEIGFLSNNEERADLVSELRKQQTAKAIADGIIKYLNGK